METQGLFSALNIPVNYCGIGKINATFKTAEVILKTGCRHILNLGTAGSHRFPTHSTVECQSFIQRDMDLSPLGFPLGETPMDEIQGRIEVPTFFSNLPKAVCGTGDRFEVGPPQLDCDVVEMEAYAIAKVCRKLGVGLTSVKYITDGSDDQAHQDWFENLKPASKKLFAIYEEFFRV
ncbi:MAG: 5'-nucleosidase [Pseudobdellovibrionaceae bacterium]